MRRTVLLAILIGSCLLAFDRPSFAAGTTYVVPTALSLVATPGGFGSHEFVVAGLPYEAPPLTISCSTSSHGDWLEAREYYGPRRIGIVAKAAGLQAGSYSGTVTVQSSGETAATRAIHITFTVLAGPIAGGPTIETFAGASFVFPADGTNATEAPLGLLGAALAEPDGSILFSDTFNERLFRRTPDGKLTTLASGRFDAIARDADGVIYLTSPPRVFKLDPGGQLTVAAGRNQYGFEGDGGPATEALLGDTLNGIAVDEAGNLYIADSRNLRIRRVDKAGVITTFAGSGEYSGIPEGSPATSGALAAHSLAFDSAGNLYYSEPPYRVRRISIQGTVTTVAGNGDNLSDRDGVPAVNAYLIVTAITVDGSGNLFVNDRARIRKVDTAGIITTVAGTATQGFSGDGGAAVNAMLSGCRGLAVDSSGNLYLADTLNYRLRRVNPAGIIETVAGNGNYRLGGDGADALNAHLFGPRGLAFDTAGNTYIADTGNNRIRRVDASGTISTFAGNGFAFDPTIEPVSATEAFLRGPYDVVADDAGNVLIADTWSFLIRNVDKDGLVSTFPGDSGLEEAANGIAIDAARNVYAADPFANRVRKIDAAGVTSVFAGISTTVGSVGGWSGDGGPANKAALYGPTGVAVDGAGRVFIADRENHLVRMVDGGIITTVAGNGTYGLQFDSIPARDAVLVYPQDVAVAPTGDLYILETQFRTPRIRKVDKNGIISTVAGGLGPCCALDSGDGGPAALASLNQPQAIGIGRDAKLYVSTYDRVRRIDLEIPSTDADVRLTGSASSEPVTAGSQTTFRLTVSNKGPAIATALTVLHSLPASLSYVSATTTQGSCSGGQQVSCNIATLAVGATARIDVVAVAGRSGESVASGIAYGAEPDPSPPDNSVTLTTTVPEGYLVGDPASSGAAADRNADGDSLDSGEFGDGLLTNLDLIAVLRAVTNLPGYRPAGCSDLFDAMDAAPADRPGTRGGDGVLDNLDLLVTLRRVTSIDTSRPVRTSRSMFCPAMSGPSTLSRAGSSDGPSQPGVRSRETVRLIFEPEPAHSGGHRVAIYLTAQQPTTLAALSVGLGGGPGSELSFVPASAVVPSLEDRAETGLLALAWLSEIRVDAGQRVLLGYVERAGGGVAAPGLQVFGASGSRTDGAAVPVEYDFTSAQLRRSPPRRLR